MRWFFAALILWSTLGHAFVCHPGFRAKKAEVVEVWSGGWDSAQFLWCVRQNMVLGIPIYTEAIEGRAFCVGHPCPIHHGRLAAMLMNEDRTISMASGAPHGVLDFHGSWVRRRRRCELTGETEPNPPSIDAPPLPGRVAGTIRTALVCQRGKLPVIQFDLTRTQ